MTYNSYHVEKNNSSVIKSKLMNPMKKQKMNQLQITHPTTSNTSSEIKLGNNSNSNSNNNNTNTNSNNTNSTNNNHTNTYNKYYTAKEDLTYKFINYENENLLYFMKLNLLHKVKSSLASPQLLNQVSAHQSFRHIKNVYYKFMSDDEFENRLRAIVYKYKVCIY
eukprot:220829_1